MSCRGLADILRMIGHCQNSKLHVVAASKYAHYQMAFSTALDSRMSRLACRYPFERPGDPEGSEGLALVTSPTCVAHAWAMLAYACPKMQMQPISSPAKLAAHAAAP